MVVGQSYDLLRYAILSGIRPGDITVTGASGDLQSTNGSLSFTVTAVPEPGTRA